VNGEPRDLSGDPSRTLLFVLRDELGLTGAKPACGEGVCGACTVLADGVAIRSCVTPLDAVAGRSVTTIEGLGEGMAIGGALHPVQQAFLAEGAFQCGYCTPGMVLATAALLERDPQPADDAIVEALEGNVCRCCTYPRILRAARRAADPAAGVAAAPAAGAAAAPAPDRRAAADAPALIAARNAPWHQRSPQERDYFETLGAGLVVVLPPPETGSEWADAWTTSGGVWLHVGADGVVTAFTGKMEMGQDNTTALAMIVADAVGVGLESVRMVMADTDVCPYDEGTFGSRSTPDAGPMLQAAGRVGLETLIGLAADRLEVSPADLVPGDGAIRSRDRARAIRYTELLAGMRRLEEVGRRSDRPAAAVDPAVTGKPAASLTGVAAVTGRRLFVTDISRPGMLHGSALGPPGHGATLRSVDVSQAVGLPGVTVVQEGEFIGVVAPDVGTVERAMAAIRADWEVPGGPSEAELDDHLRAHPVEAEGWDGSFEHEAGDVDAALARAAARVEATYTAAFVAHAPLESRAAMAEWAGERVTVWTATQAPFWARADLAETLGLSEDRIRVVVPPAGGGFGGKHAAGAGIAAARLARAVGRPVRVRWRQAEEFAWGHVRPAAIIDVRGGAAADGTITGWEFRNVNAGPSAIAPPYRIANQRLSYQPADAPLRQDSYRALAATANTFARESAIDELAHALGADPLAFRLANVDDDRLAAALRAASERAGWDSSRQEAGRGLGIAGSVEKDARVATCAQVQVRPDGGVDVVRLVTAFDCGAIVNPDNLANQVEGAAVMALGPALFEAIHFEDGRITNASLSTYRVPRFMDVPAIEVVLIDHPELPSAGGGEVPLIAVAPAIANAIFAASGRRLRAMPLLPDGRLN
jgi:nicotinate dehydrogenase subunit B